VHEYVLVFGSSRMESSRFGVRVKPSVMYGARWQESCREQGGRDVAVGDFGGGRDGPQIMVEDRFSRFSRCSRSGMPGSPGSVRAQEDRRGGSRVGAASPR
jgi:hypothetical protein